MRPTIKPFFDPATSTLTYLVFDRVSRDAVVIDSVLDFDPSSGRVGLASLERVAADIRGLGLRLHYTLETHPHADHLSASYLLREQHGARVAIGERIREVQAAFKRVFALPPSFATDGSQFDRLLRDGDVAHAGALAIEVIATPGHTPACVSYRIGDALFTGDALLLEDIGTGRCDFPGGSAVALYRSVHDRLYALPAATRVFVGHDYPPGSRGPAWSSTIGEEREHNVQLRADTTLDAYVAFRAARDQTLGAPRLLLPSIQVNIAAGRLPSCDASGRRFLQLPVDTSALDSATAACRGS